jgi:FG-GAP-like repeat
VVAQSAAPTCPKPPSPPPARAPVFLYASINYQNLAEMAHGDINGDGRQDFMTIESNLGTYSIRVVRQRADGGFTLLAQPVFSNNLYLMGLSVGDLNSGGVGREQRWYSRGDRYGIAGRLPAVLEVAHKAEYAAAGATANLIRFGVRPEQPLTTRNVYRGSAMYTMLSVRE